MPGCASKGTVENPGGTYASPHVNLINVSDAYDIAKNGGLNWGLIRRLKDEPEQFITRSIRSLERRVSEHKDKISNPSNYIDANVPKMQVEHLVRDYWPKEINRLSAEVEVLRRLLEERKKS